MDLALRTLLTGRPHANRALRSLAPSLSLAATLSLLVSRALATEPVFEHGWSHGTLYLVFWTRLPDIPDIVVEWAALLPLTVYLSNARTDYDLAGEVSLRARLSVSIVPKLWELGSIARLVRHRDDFLDCASAGGDPLRVFDVQWGSVFPCYNSSAAAKVAANASRLAAADPEITRDALNAWILDHKSELEIRFPHHIDDRQAPSRLGSHARCVTTVEDMVAQKRDFGRKQLLNVITVSLRETRPGTHGAQQLREPRWAVVAAQVLLCMGAGAVLFSLGCLGTGVILWIGAVSHFCSFLVRIKRSPLYLRNRELHSGCMLVSAHENATTWTLYRGDRGTIDSLLNKPMVEIGKPDGRILAWFSSAEIFQIMAMTYVAGQKGWDAVCLLAVISLWSLTRVGSRHEHAAAWERDEGLGLTAFRCEFPARSELLGAVQLLSTEKNTAWMDGILAPSARRSVWLRMIGAVDSRPDALRSDFASLDPPSQSWVKGTAMQTLAGHTLILERLDQIARTQNERAAASTK